MSFAGAPAPTNTNGSLSFSKNQITGETQSQFGALTPEIANKRRHRNMVMRLIQDEDAMKDISKVAGDVDDAILDLFDPNDEFSKIQDDFVDKAKTLQLLQMMEKDIVVEDMDTYYDLLNKYNRQAEFSDIQEFSIAYQKQLTEDFIADLNDFFDGIGKMDAIEGAELVENTGEAITDIVKAIQDKNPKYAAIAIAEILGVEFDHEGKFDLKATLSDNLRPIMQKVIRRYVIGAFEKLYQNMGGTTESVSNVIEEEIELAEVLEEEAITLEETLSSEITALAETEAFALPGMIIGGIQATTAILNAVNGVMQAVNLSHDAYTKHNHRWADKNSGFVGFVKKIPLIGELSTAIASIVEEARDMRDYRRGQTDAQRFNAEYAVRNGERMIDQAIMKGLTDGTITYADIRAGKNIKIPIRVGLETLEADVDLGDYELDDYEDTLEDDIDQLQVDGVAELNNLESYYNDETKAIRDNLRNLSSTFYDSIWFDSQGRMIGYDPKFLSQITIKVEDKSLGARIFGDMGKKNRLITTQEFHNLMTNYNNLIDATRDVRNTRTKIQNM